VTSTNLPALDRAVREVTTPLTRQLVEIEIGRMGMKEAESLAYELFVPPIRTAYRKIMEEERPKRFTPRNKIIAAARLHNRKLKKAGYEWVEGPWQIDRGTRTDEIIVDLQPDGSRKGIWVKCAKPAKIMEGK
jgi:hypothetical protein